MIDGKQSFGRLSVEILAYKPLCLTFRASLRGLLASTMHAFMRFLVALFAQASQIRIIEGQPLHLCNAVRALNRHDMMYFCGQRGPVIQQAVLTQRVTGYLDGPQLPPSL